MKHPSLLLLAIFALLAASAQPPEHTVSGVVRNRLSGEPIADASVLVKGTGMGEKTNSDGRFRIKVSALPVTLVLTHVSFDPLELIVNHSDEMQLGLEPAASIIDGIVLASKGIPTRIRNYSSSAEWIGPSTIKQLPTTSIYDATVYKKGFDLTTSSLTFKTPSTRGFNGSGSTRVNQLVDGMDNQAPGLNFFVGNFAGPPDLDIESVELLPGASSALYGPGGMNGTLLINTKDPFRYQGLSVQGRQGIMHVDKNQRGKPHHFMTIPCAGERR